MTHAYVHTDWQVDNLKLTPHLIMDVVGEVDPGEIRVLARQVAMARKGWNNVEEFGEDVLLTCKFLLLLFANEITQKHQKKRASRTQPSQILLNDILLFNNT